MKSESKVIMATQTNVQLVIQTSYIILDNRYHATYYIVKLNERKCNLFMFSAIFRHPYVLVKKI